MSTFYTVVRCVPDPVRGEQLNIGVIVWGDGVIRSRFISNWSRLRSLGVTDLGFFRDFARRMEELNPHQATLGGLYGIGQVDEAELLRMIQTWGGAIQFTRPRASLRAPETVLAHAVSRFLRDPSDRLPIGRTRTAAAAAVRKQVEQALQARVGERDARTFLRSNVQLLGRIEPHTVDVGIVNGRPHLAAHGLSFEIRDQDEMQRHYIDAAYAASDLQHTPREVLFGVVIYPPREDAPSATVELYQRSLSALPRTGAHVLTEQEFGAWAEDAVGQIPAEALGLLQPVGAVPEV